MESARTVQYPLQLLHISSHSNLQTRHLSSRVIGENDGVESGDVDAPSFIESPVLMQVYPALMAHQAKYGNPNIPLGSADGKRCKTLRRLHFQNKLSEEEVSFLTEIGFRFNSFEDVYIECDFDEMLGKLVDYQKEFQTFQIPKKYQPDPELGAWVTMLRRLNNAGDLPIDQVDKLNEIGFEWISSRKCGSAFMSRYREALTQLNDAMEANGDVTQFISDNDELKKWLIAQKLAFENGKLSESRAEYMDVLPGVNWRQIV